jgi:hypothetical protein
VNHQSRSCGFAVLVHRAQECPFTPQPGLENGRRSVLGWGSPVRPLVYCRSNTMTLGVRVPVLCTVRVKVLRSEESVIC